MTIALSEELGLEEKDLTSQFGGINIYVKDV